MASSFLRTLILCLVLLLFRSCLASRQSSPQGSYEEGECNFKNLKPVEPKERIQHEAGYTDVWDENEQQLQCAGAAVTRHVIQNKGLFVPSFNNAPSLVFVLQGRGVLGVVYPGCAETFQSFQQSAGKGGQGQGQESRIRDQHQKIQELRQGDVVALETGIAHWAYNEANEDLVLLIIHDISNRQNQLDQRLRRFFFAGNQPQGQPGQKEQPGQEGREGQGQKPLGFNFLQALDTEILARAIGVKQEVIQKLQNPKDFRGFIVRVQEGLRLARPFFEEQKRSQQQQPGMQSDENGFEETICAMRIKENIFNPGRADIYTEQGGSISTLNSFNLPILGRLRLSAGRGRLQPNAIVVPHWNTNAHSISYVTSGSGRVQIAGEPSEPLYDGQISQGQLLIIPQNFIHFKEAGKEGLEWVTLKTNDKAKSSPIIGKTSVFRGIPLDVWINVYQINREEAQALKYNRDEVTILNPHFKPESESQQGRSPWSVL